MAPYVPALKPGAGGCVSDETGSNWERKPLHPKWYSLVMSDKKLKEARRLFPGPRRRRPRDLTQQTDVPVCWMLCMTEEVKKVLRHDRY
jgi:hypothetical protein